MAVDFAAKEVHVRVTSGSGSDSPEALRHAIRAVDLSYAPELIEGPLRLDLRDKGKGGLQ